MIPAERGRTEADVLTRRYEHDGRTVIAVDFGPGAEPSIDVVGGTAIIVAGDRQHEVDLPGEVVEAVNRNGVVTIEVNQ